MNYKYFIAVSAPLLLALSCTTEEPLPSGFDALHRKSSGELLVTTVPAAEAAQYRAPVRTGLSGTLLLGRYDGITSRVLLRFTNFSTIDSASVQSATLTLTQTAKWGDGPGFNGTIHALDAAALWNEKSVEWPVIRGHYDPASIGGYAVEAADSAALSFDIAPQLVNSWISGDSSSNHGILLDFADATMMAQLLSVDVIENYPRLKIAWIKSNGDPDTVTIGPTADASLLEYDQINAEYTLEPPDPHVWLDNLRGYRALLRFDMAGIPSQATIHQALLTLPIDTRLSKTGAAGLAYEIRQVTGDTTWQTLNPIVTDSTFSLATGAAVGSLETATIATTPAVSYLSNLVQRWTTGSAVNAGLLLQSSGYGSDAGKVALYSGAGGTDRPTLRITYSLPASARF